ncbi:MAG: GNAT family N-acetyltransferase [Rhodanobacteraceae bacterium]|nr:GNAT family N-acetyltransferase [Rhodanobacteraceae bacterium]
MSRTPSASARRGAGGATTTRGGPPARKSGHAAAKAPARKAAPAKAAATRTPAAAPTAARKRVAGHHELVTAAPSAEAPSWSETLADGTHITIRPLGKQDAALERAFIAHLSPRSRRLRFLGQLKEPSDAFVRQLTDIDYRRDMAFVALMRQEGEEHAIGISRYSTSADGQSSECAVAVSDEWQKKGLGTLLMRHLIDMARSRGVRTMVSIDAADNAEMRDLAAFLGFRRRTDFDNPSLVIHTLDLA